MPVANRYALYSVGIALVVLALKYAAYWFTGSIALLSDALESIINVVVAAAALFALQVSARPADANHPFGHHKAEYFSAVFEGVLIILAALAIFREAYDHVQHPKTLQAPALGIALNGAASVVNGLWSWRLFRVGRSERSPALLADARHIMTDVLSSVGVIAGLIVAILTGELVLDAVIAAAVGVYILFSGWRLLEESVGGLMDQAVEPALLEKIRNCIAREAEGAIEVHDLQTRHAGPATFIQFHLVVPARMTVADAHDICDRIEAALQDHVPGAHVTIHVEPENKAKHAGVLVL